jgi:TrmH family RNA methyltransferase
MRENIIFILVRPQFLGNLGSTARVMKNFGFEKLRLVAPPHNYKGAEARKMAVGAFDILKNAELYATLGEALSDVVLAVGTTSGNQREFKQEPIDASARFIAESSSSESAAATNRCAIVFGDEVNGLSRAELQRCHHVTTVPTNPEFAALNLSQAVGICAYELNRALGGARNQPAQEYPTGAFDDELFASLEQLLNDTGFTRTFNRAKVMAELRSFYQRAHPTKREAELLMGALIRLRNPAAPKPKP